MLPKLQRLNLKKNFKFVASGAKLETRSFKLMYRFSTNDNPLVGVAISSSNFKKANLRNKARRLSYLAIEDYYLDLPKGINLVIMPKAGILNDTVDELKKELKNVKDIFESN